MTPLWFMTVAALCVALLAWRQARRAARRLEHLSQMYWDLKYQHGELRQQVRRMTDPAAHGPSGDPPASAPTPAPPSQPTQAFVPLTSLKR